MSDELLGLNLTGTANQGPTESDRALAAGVVAAIASLAVAAVPWWFFSTPLLPLKVADALFAVMPIQIVEFGVSFLGPYAKRFAFGGCVMGYVVTLGYLGAAYLKARPRAGLFHATLFGAAVWLVASITAIPLAGGGVAGVAWGPNALASAATLLASGLVYGALTAALFARFETDERLAQRGANLASRRVFLGSLIASGVAVVVVEGVRTLASAFGWIGNGRVSGGSGEFPDINGLSREVTPTADFYHISKNVFDPDGPPSAWGLEVSGLVDRPRRYTLDDLRAMAAVEGFATLACISNFVGDDLIGNAYWRGVSLKALLDEAGIQSGAVDVVFRAFDDYSDSIPVERAVQPGTMLAYEMNGEPLTPTHGAPLRAVIPGIFGMKNVKWISGIEVVAVDFKGYWQRRGWDDRAEYQTMSRIDVVAPARQGQASTIAGIAFAGDRGIQKVEVSTDAGRTWRDAEVRPPLSPYTWVLWRLVWTPERAGATTVVVRATDGRGVLQTEKQAQPIPSGATGWHSVSAAVDK